MDTSLDIIFVGGSRIRSGGLFDFEGTFLCCDVHGFGFLMFCGLDDLGREFRLVLGFVFGCSGSITSFDGRRRGDVGDAGDVGFGLDYLVGLRGWDNNRSR